MKILHAEKQLEAINGLTVVAQGQTVSISNETIDEWGNAAELVNAQERKPLAGLCDMPRWGLYFAEFWGECAQIEVARQIGEVFGIGRTEAFIRTTDKILHLAFEMDTQSIVEITYAAPDMMHFVIAYRRFLALIFSQDLDADAPAKIAENLRRSFPELTKREGPDGMVNYWWGIADALPTKK